MWVKFDLQGMKLKFKVEKYIPNQTIDGEWTEIDDIRNFMEKLLDDKLEEEVNYKCIEPDFEFTFSPKYDVRNDPDVIWVKSGNEIRDIEMKLKVNLWNEGLTCNYFSTTFNKEEIEIFYLYLSLITNKISKDNDKINNLITEGIIYKDTN